MGCGCGKGTSPQWEVVLPDGKVAFTTPAKVTAEAVVKRYPGAVVRERKPAPKTR